jgi:hypothetical protein
MKISIARYQFDADHPLFHGTAEPRLAQGPIAVVARIHILCALDTTAAYRCVAPDDDKVAADP